VTEAAGTEMRHLRVYVSFTGLGGSDFLNSAQATCTTVQFFQQNLLKKYHAIISRSDNPRTQLIIPIMCEDQDSTLLDLSQKISKISLQIHNHLRKTSQKVPDFSPTTREIDSDDDFEVLRNALHEATQDLQVLVDGPKATLRALYGTHYDLAAHQVALEFDFFSKVPLDGAISVDELAQQTTLDPDIVGRVLRLLATQRVFSESGKNEFSHTALSAIVAQDNDLKSSFHMQMDEIFQAAGETATCLRDSGRALESTHCAFSRRFGMSIFEYYNKHPEKGERFGRALAGATKCWYSC
jgi:hypothetical protein